MRKDIYIAGMAMVIASIVLFGILYTNLLVKIEEKNENINKKNFKDLPYKFEKGDRIKLSFNSQNNILEVFFCDENNFKKFIDNKEIKEKDKHGLVKNKTKGEINFVVQEGGVWHLVFINVNEEDIKVNYRIEIVFYISTLILYYAGIIFIIVGTVLIPTSFFLKKRKKQEDDFILVEEDEYFIEEQEQYHQINQLVCKSCRRIIDYPERYYYNCPFCGRSLR